MYSSYKIVLQSTFLLRSIKPWPKRYISYKRRYDGSIKNVKNRKYSCGRDTLIGKRALITGGAAGVGLACAKALLRGGCCGISIADKNKTSGICALNELCDEFGEDKAIFLECDISRSEYFNWCFNYTSNHFNGIDIVVNAALIFDDKQWESELATNVGGMLIGNLLSLQYLSEKFQGRGGTVLNIASTMALKPESSFPIYSMTQASIISLTRSLGCGMQKDRTKVKVMGLCIDLTCVPQFDNLADRTINEYYCKEVLKFLEKSQYQSADHVAKSAINVLLSGESGDIFAVSGGNEMFKINFPVSFHELKSSECAQEIEVYQDKPNVEDPCSKIEKSKNEPKPCTTPKEDIKDKTNVEDPCSKIEESKNKPEPCTTPKEDIKDASINCSCESEPAIKKEEINKKDDPCDVTETKEKNEIDKAKSDTTSINSSNLPVIKKELESNFESTASNPMPTIETKIEEKEVANSDLIQHAKDFEVKRKVTEKKIPYDYRSEEAKTPIPDLMESVREKALAKKAENKEIKDKTASKLKLETEETKAADDKLEPKLETKKSKIFNYKKESKLEKEPKINDEKVDLQVVHGKADPKEVSLSLDKLLSFVKKVLRSVLVDVQKSKEASKSELVNKQKDKKELANKQIETQISTAEEKDMPIIQSKEIKSEEPEKIPILETKDNVKLATKENQKDEKDKQKSKKEEVVVEMIATKENQKDEEDKQKSKKEEVVVEMIATKENQKGEEDKQKSKKEEVVVEMIATKENQKDEKDKQKSKKEEVVVEMIATKENQKDKKDKQKSKKEEVVVEMIATKENQKDEKDKQKSKKEEVVEEVISFKDKSNTTEIKPADSNKPAIDLMEFARECALKRKAQQEQLSLELKEKQALKKKQKDPKDKKKKPPKGGSGQGECSGQNECSGQSGGPVTGSTSSKDSQRIENKIFAKYPQKDAPVVKIIARKSSKEFVIAKINVLNDFTKINFVNKETEKAKIDHPNKDFPNAIQVAQYLEDIPAIAVDKKIEINIPKKNFDDNLIKVMRNVEIACIERNKKNEISLENENMCSLMIPHKELYQETHKLPTTTLKKKVLSTDKNKNLAKAMRIYQEVEKQMKSLDSDIKTQQNLQYINKTSEEEEEKVTVPVIKTIRDPMDVAREFALARKAKMENEAKIAKEMRMSRSRSKLTFPKESLNDITKVISDSSSSTEIQNHNFQSDVKDERNMHKNKIKCNYEEQKLQTGDDCNMRNENAEVFLPADSKFRQLFRKKSLKCNDLIEGDIGKYV